MYIPPNHPQFSEMVLRFEPNSGILQICAYFRYSVLEQVSALGSTNWPGRGTLAHAPRATVSQLLLHFWRPRCHDHPPYDSQHIFLGEMSAACNTSTNEQIEASEKEGGTREERCPPRSAVLICGQ